MARPKRTTLREKLNETTRELIVDATIAQLTERGPFDFSYFELSRRAGVAVRTIYRHFPTRDDLFDALSRRANRDVGFALPRSRDEVPAFVRALFLTFDQHADLITAQMHAGAGKVRKGSRTKRAGVMHGGLAKWLPHLPAERRLAAVAILTCLMSASTWHRLREDFGLDGARAGEATAWAIDTLWRALERK